MIRQDQLTVVTWTWKLASGQLWSVWSAVPPAVAIVTDEVAALFISLVDEICSNDAWAESGGGMARLTNN